MAANHQFVIRCKSENGSFLLHDVSSETTVGELKTKVSRVINKSPGSLKILSGYPPQALGSDVMTLRDANIRSGETIIIQTIPEPPQKKAELLGSSFEKSKHEKPASKPIDEKGDRVGIEHQPASDSGIMMRHVVPSNNSCLFSSVHFVLSSGDLSSDKNNELRSVVARAVSENPTKYNAALLGMSNEAYCIWIQNTEHWGGAIELAILSEHFGIEIVAVDTLSLNMHRFGETFNYVNRIFLIYDGIHYDPLVLERQDGSVQSVFTTTDNFPMEMAFEIAREAKSSRQYTDVANFTLRCMICDAHLNGETEARNHAVATGHIEFGEITK